MSHKEKIDATVELVNLATFFHAKILKHIKETEGSDDVIPSPFLKRALANAKCAIQNLSGEVTRAVRLSEKT